MTDSVNSTQKEVIAETFLPANYLASTKEHCKTKIQVIKKNGQKNKKTDTKQEI